MLNPHPEAKGVGRIMAPLLAVMIRRLNRQHLDALRRVLESGDGRTDPGVIGRA